MLSIIECIQRTANVLKLLLTMQNHFLRDSLLSIKIELKEPKLFISIQWDSQQS